MGGARRGAAGIRPKVVAGVFADAQTVRPYIQYADVMNIKGCTVVQCGSNKRFQTAWAKLVFRKYFPLVFLSFLSLANDLSGMT